MLHPPTVLLPPLLSLSPSPSLYRRWPTARTLLIHPDVSGKNQQNYHDFQDNTAEVRPPHVATGVWPSSGDPTWEQIRQHRQQALRRKLASETLGFAPAPGIPPALAPAGVELRLQLHGADLIPFRQDLRQVGP